MTYKYRKIKQSNRRIGDDAVYQFVLDHSTPVPGGFHIQFYIRNKQDFFTRVKARELGWVRTDNLDKEWIEVAEKDQQLKELHQAKQHFIKKWIIKFLGL